MDASEFYAQHVPATLLPIMAAGLVYGWAAIATIALVVISAWWAGAVWSKIGWRGRQINRPQTLWMSMLLAMTLPANLLGTPEAWAIVPAAGILLIVLALLLGPLGAGRVQPPLVGYWVLLILSSPVWTAHNVLKPSHLFLGTLREVEPIT